MFRIRPARVTDHGQVVALLTRLQSVPSHHIGFHGETEIELVDELADLRWPVATVVAVDAADRVRGVLSVAVDGGRAWWYGPFVDVPADHPAADRIWARTADALYAAGRGLPIALRVNDSELYGHVTHRRLAAFARRHGFPAGEYSSLLVLDGVDLVRLVGTVPDTPGVDIAELARPVTDVGLAEALARLHERSFPATYLSPGALVGGERTVVVATVAGTPAGYAAGAAQPADYFLDYVAVAEEFRCRGVGTALVTTLVQALAERCGAREAACAVVAGGNAPSRGMLRGLGFEPRLELVSYRLRATSLVA